MVNPFCAPGRTVHRPGPLNPWEQSEHNDYYVPVDHTEEAFQEFVDYLETSDILIDGGMYLVHGEDGCGKTSLVHRCAKKVKSSLEQDNRLVGIVDLSSDVFDAQPFLTKCQDTVRRALRYVRQTDRFLSPPASQSLPEFPTPSDEDALRIIMQEVAQCLDEEDRVLVIVPPKLDLENEVQLYLSIFSRKRLALILETNKVQVREHVVSRNRDPGRQRTILDLEVGPLEAEQGWAFVKARMERTAEIEQLPKFEQDAVNKYMRQRTQGKGRISVRELERVCIKLFGEAVEWEKPEISYEDFVKLYLKYGELTL